MKKILLVLFGACFLAVPVLAEFNCPENHWPDQKTGKCVACPEGKWFDSNARKCITPGDDPSGSTDREFQRLLKQERRGE